MSATAFKLSYNPALDGLRALAIALVMLSHAHVPLLEGAFFGVDLFFVLSGYLITHLLLLEIHSQQRIDYWRFYRRRFFRLMPPLLLFLAVYCVLGPVFWADSGDWYIDALVSGLYLADYGIAFFDLPNSLLHMWSLSVEEHFYLLWPVLLLVLVRRTPKGALWQRILGLFVLAWLWRVLWVVQGQQFYEIFFRFDTRATGLLAGCLLAALLVEQPAWFVRLRPHARHGLWLLLALPWVLRLAWDDMGVMVWAMTVVEALAVVLIVLVQSPQGRLRAWLSRPSWVRLGQLSYGMYLWHYPVYRVLRAHWDWPVVVLAGALISYALAAASWATVERWGRHMRDAPAGAAAPKARSSA